MDPRIVRAGDAAVIVQFEERIDAEVNGRAVALSERVSCSKLPGIVDVVPTYRSVAIYFDPLRTDYPALHAFLAAEAASARAGAASVTAPVRIPVHYGGEAGPDLADVAAFAGMSEDEVVALHTSAVYRVFMLGFVPGFAYMGIVPRTIAAPRRTTPRLRVPAGSVGIAGEQTAVYPIDTPGGWQLIGRTSVRLFDITRSDPFLLKAGDAVQFYAAGAGE